jgi:hypothetical protein
MVKWGSSHSESLLCDVAAIKGLEMLEMMEDGLMHRGRAQRSRWMKRWFLGPVLSGTFRMTFPPWYLYCTQGCFTFGPNPFCSRPNWQGNWANNWAWFNNIGRWGWSNNIGRFGTIRPKLGNWVQRKPWPNSFGLAQRFCTKFVACRLSCRIKENLDWALV